MPSRQNVKKIVTPIEIQGEDAYVSIKSITIDEAKALQELSIKIDKEVEPERKKLYQQYADDNSIDIKDLTDIQKAIALSDSEIVKKAESFFYDYYADYVLDWNWVLEDNSDMPKPHKNPSVFGSLTTQEFLYIQSLFKQDDKTEKN